MSTNTTDATMPSGSALLDEIEAQRKRVLGIRQRQEAEMAEEMDRFAALLAATRNDEDPEVHPTAAARRIGVNRNYVFQLVRDYEREHGRKG